MKKVIALSFIMAFVFTAFAGNGVAESPKATNYKQILNEIVYPKVCQEQGIEGMVIVMLNIDKHGEIVEYDFKSYPCNDLKEAVEKSLSSMTFKPAINENGENVAGKLALPVNFKLTI